MLDTMFDLFTLLKQQYPDSDITSEFITYTGNEYAVCAVVKIGDRTLSTGMASASSIEDAEDRAKTRAIESLGIRYRPNSEIFLPRNNENVGQEDSPASTPSAKPALTKLSPPSARKRATPPKQKVDTSVNDTMPLTSHSEASNADLSLEERQERPESMMTEMPSLSEPSDHAKAGNEKPNQPQHSEVELPAHRPTNEPSPTNVETEFNPQHSEVELPAHRPTNEPSPTNVETEFNNVNLVDAIAKTSVEMHRLGWDTHQGRQHLQATYNKRSRGELTDEELLDFLQFLEKQPNP